MDEVVSVAKSWLGTPYHPGARVKGYGVDCAMLLAEVYQEAGLLDRVEPGFYPRDFGLHRDEERFLHWVLKYAEEVEHPQAGDAAVFKFGRCFSHGAIMVDDKNFVHAAQRDGMVTMSSLDSAEVFGREVKFYRVPSLGS